MRATIRRSCLTVVALLAGFAVVSIATWSQRAKEPLHPFDHLTTVRPELRVVEIQADADLLEGAAAQAEGLRALRAEAGGQWRAWMDLRRGVPSLLEGGAIPFIPGPANDLDPAEWGMACPDPECLPAGTVESLALEFLWRHRDLFQVDPSQFVPIRDGLGAAGHMAYANFQQVVAGVPVEGAVIRFRINNGNLIQVVTEKVAAVRTDPRPALSLETAWQILAGYLQDFPREKDEILDTGSLLLIPVLPRGADPNRYEGEVGAGLDHVLCYRLSFRRPGVVGMWEALVDAHSGEIVRFVDANRYGRVHGVVYPGDNHNNPSDRPFPFVRTNLPAPNDYADVGGLFPGDSATVDLTQGKYTWINDSCGSTSLSTTTGDADYGQSVGTDCGVPSPNPGGPGNTWSAKIQYYHLTNINIKARTYMPGNTWLNSSHMNVNVNQNAWCNATSGGGTLNFYKAAAGCWNLGEIPGVSLHEWGHSMDDYDGSGGDSPPVETRADWTATLQLHDSCTGRGAFTSGNCDGYGDACTGCSGIRDADYMMHASQTPWTPQNQGSGGVWNCGGSGSYNGPCGWEDHCESGLSTQALWDFVNRDLPALCGLDLPTAWQLADRLFYSSMPTLGNMYTCTPPTSNGCNGGSLYSTMRAFDDDGDGTANGTPHAAAIYSSLARHGIACGSAGDATNQNQTSCPSLTVPTASVAAGSDSALLTWTSGGPNATRYFIYRNEMNCDAGFTKVATVNAPSLAYTDTTVVNGITYFYRVQAATASDSCVSAMSACATVTPMPCAGSVSLSKAVVRCTDSVGVTVVDSNVPGSPATLAVEAWSTADGSHKSFTLSNTPPGSAVYTGTVATTDSSTPGPSEVRMTDGATLTVRYVDADYCGTPNVDVDGTASGDCRAPVISDVSASVSGQNVTVTWTTDEPADSRVRYGTSVPPSSTGSDAAYGTAHSVTLSALEACRGYYYAVDSADPAGNSSSDDNGGAYYAFTTGVTSAPTYTRTETPGLAIPDANPAGVTSVLSVPDDKVIVDVNVTIHSITHTYDGDLDIYLVSPQGTQVELSTDNGGSGENFTETVLDDEASSSITGGTAPFTGTFRPEGSLSAFDGQVAAGNWGLKVVDDAGSDTGTIDSWSLSFTFPAQSCGAELAYASHLLTDACTGSGGGGGDGVWDAGEEAILAVTAENVGTSGATAVLGSLSTSTPGILVLVDSASYSDIPSGEERASDPPHFRVFADPSVSCGTSATFSLHLVSNQGAWDDTFSVMLGQPVPGSGTALDEDFGSGIPGTWTVVDGGSGGGAASTWTTSNPGGRNATAPITDPFAIVDSDEAGWGVTQDEQLITPVLDLSAATTVTLEFDHYFYRYESEVCDVDVRSSRTSGAWQNVGRWTGASTANPEHETLDLTSRAAGASDAQVRFRYYNGSYEWYWMVDNVRVTYTAPGGCAMSACVPAAAPGETAGTPATHMKWTDDSTLEWGSNTEAYHYHLYRGVLADLSALLDGGLDSCKRLDNLGLPEATGLSDDPAAAPGGVLWYLVTGWNPGGDGHPGSASAGPRHIDPTGACP